MISGAHLDAMPGASPIQAFRRYSQALLARYRADGTRQPPKTGALLGFSEPSAFSRWHLGRFGTSARQAGLGSVASSPS